MHIEGLVFRFSLLFGGVINYELKDLSLYRQASREFDGPEKRREADKRESIETRH